MSNNNEQNPVADNVEDNKIPIEIVDSSERNSESNQQPLEGEEMKKENSTEKNEISEKIKAFEDELKNLHSKNKELEAEVSELKDKRLRTLAEFENYKRRSQNELSNFFKYASEGIIKKVLPVYDDLQRSLLHADDSQNHESFLNGIKMVYDKFTKILEDEGVKKIEAKGRQFDFNFHEALLQQNNDQVPNNTVLEEIEAGYMYKEKVLRHAKVIVSIAAETEEVKNDNSSESAE